MSAVIGIDGGKSGLRMRIRDATGTSESEGSGFSYASSADADEAQIVASVTTAFNRLGAPSEVSRVCAGLTGLPATLRARSRLSDVLSKALNAPVILLDDGATAHAGAVGGAGTVLSAGTGSVALALNAAGAFSKVDGWGYHLGDRGSGYAIGLAGLRAAVAGHERAGRPTTLTSIVAGSLERRSGAVQDFYRDAQTTSRISDFAIHVIAAAGNGDEVARRICHRAAKDLARSVARASSDVGLTGPTTRVAVTGRLLQQQRSALTEMFERELRRRGLHLTEPRGDALDGALNLAERPDPAYLPLLRAYAGGLS